MTKEEKVKELLESYEMEGMELSYEYEQKTHELPEPFDDDVTDEQWEQAEKQAAEIKEWYQKALQEREQRFIRAIVALEGKI